jgi:hypothetical protein
MQINSFIVSALRRAIIARIKGVLELPQTETLWHSGALD